jgi:tyrosine-protein kinase Etk/Wzc
MNRESSLDEVVDPVIAPPSAQNTPVRVENEISLIDLLIVLAKRKRLIFWVTVCFGLVSLVVSFLLPVRYTATVILLPPQQKSSLTEMFASQLGSVGSLASLAGGGLSIKNPNDMYVAMFKSQTVENGMVRRFGLMQEYHKAYLSDARKEFEQNTTTDGNGKDGLIHISVEDHDPKRAAELANGYVDEFRDLSQHLAISEAAQRALFFKEQLAQANDKLVKAEDALVETEKKTGLIQVNAQARALIESAASLNAQIAAKEVQIQGIRTYANGDNAQLIRAEQELDGLRAQLAKLGGSQDVSAGGIIVPKGLVPTASLEYVRRVRDVKYYDTIFNILAQQFELAKLDEAKEGALIQVVDPAYPPDRRSFPKRTWIVIGATFLGLIFGVLLAFWQASIEHMKEDPETLSKIATLRRYLSVKRHPGDGWRA